MSFKTVLSDIGTGLKTFFADATKIAQAEEPIVDAAVPGIAALYNKTVSLAVTAEGLAAAAGAQSGTGASKLAFVVNALKADFNAYWTSLGYTVPAPVTVIENWVNTVVAGLNAIPAKTA